MEEIKKGRSKQDHNARAINTDGAIMLPKQTEHSRGGWCRDWRKGWGQKENLAREEMLCTGSLTQIQWGHLGTKAQYSKAIRMDLDGNWPNVDTNIEQPQVLGPNYLNQKRLPCATMSSRPIKILKGLGDV